MKTPKPYTPGPAAGAEIRKDAGQSWTLILVRELAHPPAKVWKALTEPDHLREWAPFDADRSLATVGTANLTTVGAPKPHVTETKITRADPPKTLEFDWGGGDVRWELAPHDGGTRLTLWAQINRHYIAMGAAGWHVCIDVLDRHLAGEPIGRLAGPAAMQVPGWNELHGQYAAQFGVETPTWS